MELKAPYSAGFKEQALSKVLSRGSRTIQSVADELTINVFPLKNWMKQIAQFCTQFFSHRVIRLGDVDPDDAVKMAGEHFFPRHIR